MMQALVAKLRTLCQWLAIPLAFVAGALLAWSLSPDVPPPTKKSP